MAEKVVRLMFLFEDVLNVWSIFSCAWAKAKFVVVEFVHYSLSVHLPLKFFLFSFNQADGNDLSVRFFLGLSDFSSNFFHVPTEQKYKAHTIDVIDMVLHLMSLSTCCTMEATPSCISWRFVSHMKAGVVTILLPSSTYTSLTSLL